MTQTITGHFRDSNSAQSAIQQLEHAGIVPPDVRYTLDDTGGTLVLVRVNDDTVERAKAVLNASGAENVRGDPRYQHGEPSDFGEEGGSSQWGQTVLRVQDGDSEVAERTFSRDRGSKRLD